MKFTLDTISKKNGHQIFPQAEKFMIWNGPKLKFRLDTMDF